VAYLNTDNSGRGYLSVGGSHILEKFINGVAKSVTDPETGATVERRMRASREVRAPASRADTAQKPSDLPIGALGSGSDYTTFLQHLGVPSMNLGFYGEGGRGSYHSAYDDFYWYTHFSDTSFVYGRALAQTVGTAVMRLADADVIPYDYTDLAGTVKDYTGQLKRLVSGMAADVKKHNQEVRDSSLFLTTDPRHPMIAPVIEADIPKIDFSPLDSAVASLSRAATSYHTIFTSALARATTSEDFAALNMRLIQSEHMLTSDAGLPGRPWFKHLLYAPGVNTGYGVKTIPGVREAIEAKDWTLARSEMVRVSAALNAEAALITQAATALGK
jgi:N-acetylated-alpha-linked acidic dipeptidase